MRHSFTLSFLIGLFCLAPSLSAKLTQPATQRKYHFAGTSALDLVAQAFQKRTLRAAEPWTSDIPTLADGEISFGSNEVIATIELDNKSVLRFVKLESNHMAVLEESPKGALSISTVGLPKDTPVAEVFHAFAASDMPMPNVLKTGFSKAAEARPQGWARQLMSNSTLVSQQTTGNCNDSNFRSWFDQFNYSSRSTPNFRLNQIPRNSPFFERYTYAPGNGQSYRFYRYTVGGNIGSIWYDVDRYASRVAVCRIGSIESENIGALAHPPISYQGFSSGHMGPYVRMMYRRPGQTTWNAAIAKDFEPGDVGSILSWHFNTGNDWDWRTDISFAGADDSFDIGHSLADL